MMRTLLSLMLFTSCAVTFAGDFIYHNREFLQVYEADKGKSVSVVECGSNKEKSICRIRNYTLTGLTNSCLLASKVDELNAKRIQNQDNTTSWVINQGSKKPDLCDFEVQTTFTGSAMIFETKLIKSNNEICKMFDQKVASVPRLEIGVSPTLNTSNCDTITIVY